MKFYIISLILNMLLLFIPVAIPNNGGNIDNKANIVKVNINNLKTESEEKEIEVYGNPSFNVSKEEKKKEIKEIIKKEPDKQESVSLPKKSGSDVISNHNMNNNRFSSSGISTANNTSGDTYESGVSSGMSSENKNSSASNDRAGNSGSGEKRSSGGNVCREGIDYIVNYNPSLPYPIAAQRAGISAEAVVNVRFSFTSGGKVSVLSVSGGHPSFHNEAKAATGKIRVTIKNPETLKCTITKPFRFRRG